MPLSKRAFTVSVATLVVTGYVVRTTERWLGATHFPVV